MNQFKSHTRLLLSTTLLLFNYNSFGQTNGKQITHQQLIWYGYFNTIDFSEKGFLTTEVQERRFTNPDKQHQLLLRTHLHYKIGNGWDAALGFTYYLQSPQDPFSQSTLVIPELRPHLEFNYKQIAGKVTLLHRYKTEWRFLRNTNNGQLDEGYWNYFRFRYRIGLDFQLFSNYFSKKPVKLRISDEVLINVGHRIVKNVFDQNRLYVGINFQIIPSVSIEAGYLNLFQQRTAGDQFYDRDIIRFTLYHKIILLKKSNQQ